MRAELLNSVLPDRVTTAAMQKGTLTVLDLLFITLQTYLPSEPSARVDGLSLIQAPLRSAKNFNEALSTLRTWRQQIIHSLRQLFSVSHVMRKNALHRPDSIAVNESPGDRTLRS